MKIAETLALYCKTHSCGNCELVNMCSLGSQVMNTFRATPSSWNKTDFDRINKSFEFEVRTVNHDMSEQERWKKDYE